VAPEAPPSDAELQAAKSEFEEAQTLYIKENFDGAAEKFISAYEKKPFASFLFNVAVAYEKAKRLELAISYYQQYVDKKPDAKDGKDVKLRIEGLKRQIAPPPPPVPGQPIVEQASEVAMLPAIQTKGLVVIDSKPPGATIYLNNKKDGPLGRTPWEGSLEPVPGKIIMEAKGFKAEERQINPRSDKLLELYIALSEEHFLGWVEIASNVAGAEVFLDRKEIGAIGKTPYTGHLKPGKHTIWVEKTGYGSVKKAIEVLPGTATTHELTLSKVAVGWIAVVGKKSKGAKLFVDEKFACATPCQQEVVPGDHKVVVEQEGMEDYESQVKVEQAVQTVIDVSWSPKPPKTRAWTTAVMSAVFLGGGIYLGLESNRLRDDVKADTMDPNNLSNDGDPRVQEGKMYAIGANVAFGLSLITGIISVIGFVSSGDPSTGETDEKQIARVKMVPFSVQGGGGLSAAGRF
jgi:hypothetical protein